MCDAEPKIDDLLNRYECGGIDRRSLLTGLVALVSSSSAAAQTDDGKSQARQPPSQTNPDQPAFQGKSLNHVTLSVSQVPRSQDFYQRILGIETISTQPGGVNLGLGDSFIGLYAIKEEPRVNHFCVGLDEYRVRTAAERLRQFGITPRVRQDKPEVYFEDPDGITVQLESKNYRG